MMKQNELILQMDDKELKKQLIISQLFMGIIAFMISLFLFDSVFDWFQYVKWDIKEVAYYGILPGLIIVLLDLIIMTFIPKKYFDDGGINEKLFKNRSIIEIFQLALVVAICEELLFRGVIQTTFGLIIASVIFALVHVRYLKKPLLLGSVLFISFYIGYLFYLTENLLVTITAHFLIDFLLGLIIRFKK